MFNIINLSYINLILLIKILIILDNDIKLILTLAIILFIFMIILMKKSILNYKNKEKLKFIKCI